MSIHCSIVWPRHTLLFTECTYEPSLASDPWLVVPLDSRTSLKAVSTSLSIFIKTDEQELPLAPEAIVSHTCSPGSWVTFQNSRTKSYTAHALWSTSNVHPVMDDPRRDPKFQAVERVLRGAVSKVLHEYTGDSTPDSSGAGPSYSCRPGPSHTSSSGVGYRRTYRAQRSSSPEVDYNPNPKRPKRE